MPPSHPIDRSRLSRFVTSTRIRCAISAAYSSKLNPRNLEVDYYPAYNHTLAALVDFEFDGALTVRQQYDLWLSKSTFDLYKIPPGALETANYYWFDDDGEEEEDPTIEDIEIPVPGKEADVAVGEGQFQVDVPDIPAVGTPPVSSSPPRHASTSGRPIRNKKPAAREVEDYLISSEARAAQNPSRELTQEELINAIKNMNARELIVDNLSDAPEADISLETLATVPDSDGKDLFPDMLLCHSYAIETDRPADENAHLGWQRRARCKISHHCFPLIMEIKTCPSRPLRGAKLAIRLHAILKNAAEEAYVYVQAYFTRDQCATSVIAMVAAGPYWRWIQIERGEIRPGLPTDEGNTVLVPSDPEVKAIGAFTSRLNAAPTFILGTEESDGAFTQLRDEFLIPLIESHRRYPSTMVPNPQKSKEKKDGISQ